MENTDLQVFYNYWSDGSCYHTSSENWMGMGVYCIETNTIFPMPVARKLAISGPKGTHNEAEYIAILAALTDLYIIEGAARSAYVLEDREAIIHSDSQIIIRQITGEYEVKEKHMITIHKEVLYMVNVLNNMGVDIEFKRNPRIAKNRQVANLLSKQGNPYFKKILPEPGTYQVLDIEEVLLPHVYQSLKKGLKWRSTQ